MVDTRDPDRHRHIAMASNHHDCMKTEGEKECVKPRWPSVRRNLFGPVDHQQLQEDFHRLLCMSVETAKQRWNFDFKSECPTPGLVEWEEIGCQDVPAFYRSCVVRTGRRRLEAPITTDSLHRDAKVQKRLGTPVRIRYRQAIITDFFTAKKRRFLNHKVSSRQ